MSGRDRAGNAAPHTMRRGTAGSARLSKIVYSIERRRRESIAGDVRGKLVKLVSE